MTASTKAPAKRLGAPAPKAKVPEAPAPTKDDRQLTTREVAEIVGTDPRSLRKFLRASEEWANAGKGKRYAFTATDAKAMTPQFAKWAEAIARAPKGEGKAAKKREAKLRTELQGRTVKELREVLDAHGIAYNKSKVTKAALIDSLVADRDIWA